MEDNKNSTKNSLIEKIFKLEGKNCLTYKEFIEEVSKKAMLNKSDVKKVIKAMKLTFLEFEDDQYVKTPLGTFKMRKTPGRFFKYYEGEVLCSGKTDPSVKLHLNPKKDLKRPVQKKAERVELTEEERLRRKGRSK